MKRLTTSPWLRRLAQSQVAPRGVMIFLLLVLVAAFNWRMPAGHTAAPLAAAPRVFDDCPECGPGRHCNPKGIPQRQCEDDEYLLAGAPTAQTMCRTTKYGKYYKGNDNKCHWCPPDATWSLMDKKCKCRDGYEMGKAVYKDKQTGKDKQTDDDKCFKKK